jgi:hypothetical protein
LIIIKIIIEFLVLRIGDYIFLKHLATGGLLCSEGILVEDVAIESEIKLFDDCLFCIHLQRQYSAQRELQEFLAANSSVKKGQRDAQQEKYYQALKVLDSTLNILCH